MKKRTVSFQKKFDGQEFDDVGVVVTDDDDDDDDDDEEEEEEEEEEEGDGVEVVGVVRIDSSGKPHQSQNRLLCLPLEIISFFHGKRGRRL
ncbi:unnamed protein product [Sphenostylis stenocarpa]|uniref:Uncharacterized protein n=1 Tax=Sphenostylis stenocarpa TaxID=92480 RepID=A0AA86S022_9FABA|nr:unnamed protein product [Sphenostylis stenocarpa]